MPISISQCPILSLPNEVIVEILSYCSTENILNVESTCKALHEICQSRPVWHALMERLDVKQAPDVHPFESIESISDPDLRKKVIGAVRRHRTWNDPGAVPPYRTVELSLPHVQDEHIIKTRLLPNGKELLLANSGYVEFWSFETQEYLWRIPPPENHINMVGFDYEFVNDGNMLVIAVVWSVLSSRTLLRVFGNDFAAGTRELLLERRMPALSPSRIMLQGDFFMTCIPRDFQTVVINWKTGEALVLDFFDPETVRVDARTKILADNNVIAFVHRVDAGFCAVKLSLSTLGDFWSVERDHTAWRHVPFRLTDPGFSVLPLPVPIPGDEGSGLNFGASMGPWILSHHVFTPTWRQDAPTEIFVAAYICGRAGEASMRLVSFHLQLTRPDASVTGEDTGTLSLVSSNCAPISRLPRQPRNLSNAGLMFSLRQQIHCFSLFTDREQPVNEGRVLPELAADSENIEANISSVDPWTGAIAVRVPGAMKVLYFD